MLEGILEKFILSYLGPYFSGLDKKNIDIGVWKGDITLENLTLNEDMYIFREYPIKICYSKIGKVHLKVPWTKLSSAPVELSIENVTVLLKINQQADWKENESNVFDLKLSLLKKFSSSLIKKMKKIQDKANEKGGKKGYVEKLLVKIIDNIQISIKNIHVRIESEEYEFSAGATLEEIKVVTVDSNFLNPIFLKNSKEKDEKNVCKLMKVMSVQFYWISRNPSLWILKKENFETLFSSFTSQSVSSKQIISITADLKLTIDDSNSKLYSSSMASKHQIEIDIPNFDINFTLSQLKDILAILGIMDDYKSSQTLKLEMINYSLFRPNIKISQVKQVEKTHTIKLWWKYIANSAVHQQRLKLGRFKGYKVDDKITTLHMHTFITIYAKYFKKNDLKSLAKNEIAIFEDIITSYPLNIMQRWVEKITLKDYFGKSKAIEKKETDDEDIFMLRQFLRGSGENGLKEDDFKTLEKAILKSFKSEKEGELPNITSFKKTSTSLSNTNSVKYRFLFILNSGSVNLNLDERENGISFKLNYQGWKLDIQLGTKASIFSMELQNFDLYTNYQKKQLEILSVIEKNDPHNPFLRFNLEKPLDLDLNYLKIDVTIGSLDFIYYPFVMFEAKKLFTLHEKAQKGKSFAMRELRKIEKKTQVKIEEYIKVAPVLRLNMIISSPVINIPFPLWRDNYTIDSVTEIIEIKLGDLTVSNSLQKRVNLGDQMTSLNRISSDMVDSIKYKQQNFDEFNIELKKTSVTSYTRLTAPRDDDEEEGLQTQNSILIDEILEKSKFNCFNQMKKEYEEKFTIVENFSLNINISKPKNKLKDNEDYPQLILSGKIYLISVRMTKRIYELILILVRRENFAHVRSELLQEKKNLYYNAIQKGHLNYQGKTIKTWYNYLAMISGTMLYCYRDEKSIKPEIELNLAGCKVRASPEESKNQRIFCIIINEERYYFESSSSDKMKAWVAAIQSINNQEDGQYQERGTFSKLNMKKILAQISLEIDHIQFILEHDLQREWLKFDIWKLYFYTQQTTQSIDLKLKLEEINLSQPSFIQVNKLLKSSLLYSKGEDEENKTLIDIQIIINLPPDTGNTENVDVFVDFKFGNLTINWKPSIIKSLIEYFTPSPHVIQASTIAAMTATLDDAELILLSKPSVAEQDITDDRLEREMLWLNFSVGKIRLYIEFEDLYLAFLDVIDYSMHIRIRHNQMDIEGSLSQFILNDLTQYPETLHKKEQFKLFKPLAIFKTENNESAVKFMFIDFARGAFPGNNQKKKALLNLDFSSFNLLYLQQPILRLVSYFLDSLLAILLNEQEQKPKEKCLDTLVSPSFTEMRITINRPKVTLTPNPNFDHFIEINLGDIVISNSHFKSKERIISGNMDSVWNENYKLRCSDMAVYSISRGKRTQLSDFFNLNMDIERMMFAVDYKTIHPNMKYDTTYQIKGSFTPVILCFDKFNYLILLSLMFSNLSYDDGKDKYFVRDFSKNIVKPANPIKIGLFFESIDMVLLDKYQTPIFSLGILLMDVKVERFPTREMIIKIRGEDLFGNYYNANFQKNIITETPYLSQNYVQRNYKMNYSEKNSVWQNYVNIFENVKNLSRKRNLNKTGDLKNNAYIIIELKKNRDKIINIEFNGINLQLNLKLFRTFLDFFLYSEKLQLVDPPTDASSIPINLNVPQLSVDMKFINSMILLPNFELSNAIGLKGKFGFMFARNAYQEEDLYDESDEGEDEKTISKWIFDSTQMEILMGEMKDFLSMDAEQKNLTQIFLPFSIFINSRNVLNRTGKGSNVNYSFKNIKDFNFEQANIQVTYKNFMKALKVFQYQGDCYQDYFDKISSKNFDYFPKYNTRSNSLREKSTGQMNFQIQGMKFILINDVFGANSPLIDFNISEGELIISNDNTKSNLSATFSLHSNFFNPYIGKWEPILERIIFNIDMIRSPNIIPNVTLSIDTQCTKPNPLNINISQELITIVNRDLKLCMEEYKKSQISDEEILEDDEEYPAYKKINTTLNHENSITIDGKHLKTYSMMNVDEIMQPTMTDLTEVYSPYAILNKTGFKIFVIKDRNDNIKKMNDQIKIVCPNEKVCGIHFDEKFDGNIGKENYIASKIIKLEIPINPNFSYILKGIEINQVAKKKHTITYFNPKFKQEERFYIFTNVELIGTKKILNITSVNKIVNRTNFKLNFYIQKSVHEQTQGLIEANAEMYIPLIFNHFEIYFSFPESKEVSSGFSSYNLGVSTLISEFKLNHFYFIIRKESDGEINSFIIDAPFKITNFLPVSVSLEVHSRKASTTRKHGIQMVQSLNLDVNEVSNIHDLSSNSDLFLSIRIANYIKSLPVCLFNHLKGESKEDFIIQDHSKVDCLISVYKIDQKLGCKNFCLYTKTYLVNETPYDFNFCHKFDGNLQKFPGQHDRQKILADSDSPHILLASVPNNYNKIFIVKRDNIDFRSEGISIQSIGASCVSVKHETDWNDTLKNKKIDMSCYELGIDITIKNNLKDYLEGKNLILVTKIITFYPRFIIINKTNNTIKIAQRKLLNQNFEILPNNRIPFTWADHDKKKQIKISIKDKQDSDWTWSGSLELSSIGYQHFFCINNINNKAHYYKATTTVDKAMLITVIDELKEPKYGYLIINDFPECCIEFRQNYTNKKDQYHIFKATGYNKETSFSWEKPLKEKEIRFDISFENPLIDSLTITCKPDKLNLRDTYTLESKKQKLTLKMKIKTFMKANTKVVRFYPFADQEEEDDTLEKENLKFSFRLSLGLVGISVISDYNSIRKELLYISARNLEFLWVESDKTRLYQFRIKHLQIDNNSSSKNTFPVLLVPFDKKNSSAKENDYFIVLLVKKSLKDKNALVFPLIKLLVNKPIIKIEDNLISMLISLQKSLQKAFQNPLSHSEKNIITQEAQNNNILVNAVKKNNLKRVMYYWETLTVETNKNDVYIEEFGLSYMEILFSFKKSFDSTNNTEFSLANLISGALGVALTNIDKAPIKFKGVQLSGLFDNPKGLLTKLGKFYKEDLIKSLFYIVGSIEILGNPIGLFTHITTGVVDFIEKPREGFVQGPLEGGIGIVVGTGSLIKNTFVGTINTINKITGSISTGMSTLTFDQEYIEKREKMRQKRAEDVVDGLGQGFISIYNGFGDGIKEGLFQKPIEGASKEGLTGFFKGSYQAISGLVVKPMTGILDAATKTAEGIKNMTGDDEDATIYSIKERSTRPFYGKLRFIKSYNNQDSELLSEFENDSLYQVDTYSYLNSHLMRPIISEIQSVMFLVIFEQAIGLYNCKMRRFIWIVDYKLIEKMEYNEYFINFIFKNEVLSIKSSNYVLPSSQLKINESIVQELDNMIIKSSENI